MKLNNRYQFAAAVLLTLASLAPSDAYPTGSAQCIAGDGNPGGPHAGKNMGSVDESWAVTVDGTDLSSVGSLMLRTDYTLQIAGGNFKGFLIRVSADHDVSGSLTNPAQSADIQIMESSGEAMGQWPAIATCAEDVAGATHTANAETKAYDKTEVSAGLSFPATLDLSSSNEVEIEVTVMIQTTEWYYSSYRVNLAPGAETSTEEGPSATGEEPMTTEEEPMTTEEEPMTNEEEPMTTEEEPMTTEEEPATEEEPMTTEEEPMEEENAMDETKKEMNGEVDALSSSGSRVNVVSFSAIIAAFLSSIFAYSGIFVCIAGRVAL